MNARLFARRELAGNTLTLLDFDFDQLTTATGQVRFFRNTNTSGECNLSVFKGDGTTDTSHLLSANGASFLGMNGNVGIGITNPAGNFNVAISGPASFVDQAEGTIAFGNATNDVGSIMPTIQAKSNGGTNRVGLHLIAGTADENSNPDIILNARLLTNNDFTTLTSRAFEFRRFTTSLMTILRNGNVGIGVTNPTGKLNIFTGLSGFSFNMNAQSDGSISFANASSDSAFPVISGKSTTNRGLYIVGGNDDVSTSPALQFDARTGNNTDFSTLTTPAFQFSRNGNVLKTILRNGNVGIGITNPLETDRLTIRGGQLFVQRPLVAHSGATAITQLNSVDSTLRVLGNPITTFTTTPQRLLFLHQPFNNENKKGSSLGISLSYYEDPGNNLPRTRVDFDLTSRTTDNVTPTNTVMSLVDTGNVGIGITNPGSRLRIDGNPSTLSEKTVVRIQGANTGGDSVQEGMSLLTLVDQSTAQGNMKGIAFARSTNANFVAGIQHSILANGGGNLDFYTSPAGEDGNLSMIMRLGGNGNVGIGTSNPSTLLHLSGTAGIFRLEGTTQVFAEFFTTSTQAGRAGFIGFGSGTNAHFSISNQRTGGDILLTTNNINRMFIKSDGNVGIGTSNPSQRLHVIGNILASGTITPSDIRIKTDIVEIQDGQALSKLRLIEPHEYSYIDKLSRGNYKVYGFLAQQVREHFPEATRLTQEYVPDVFKTCSVDLEEHIIVLGENSRDGRLKIQVGNQVLELQVTKVNDMTVAYNPEDLEDGQEMQEEVFVYGYQVEDFHTLNKDYLFTIHFAATQELDRTVQTQKQMLETQSLEIEDLKAVNDDLMIQNMSLKNRVSELESQLSSLITALTDKGIL
jgi:hypothetical protein